MPGEARLCEAKDLGQELENTSPPPAKSESAASARRGPGAAKEGGRPDGAQRRIWSRRSQWPEGETSSDRIGGSSLGKGLGFEFRFGAGCSQPAPLSPLASSSPLGASPVGWCVPTSGSGVAHRESFAVKRAFNWQMLMGTWRAQLNQGTARQVSKGSCSPASSSSASALRNRWFLTWILFKESVEIKLIEKL